MSHVLHSSLIAATEARHGCLAVNHGPIPAGSDIDWPGHLRPIWLKSGCQVRLRTLARKLYGPIEGGEDIVRA